MGLLTDALGVARGTREHEASESQLRLLKSVVVSANDGVLIAEAKPQDHLGGKIVYVNEAFCRMTGYSDKEAEGRTPRILLGPQSDRDQLNLVRESLSNLEPVRVEIVNYRKDGSAYWVEVSFAPIIDERGKFTHWVAVQRETTDRRRAEDLELDRNRVLELVARNEPLEKVLTHLSEMVERQCPDLQCAILLLRDGQMVQAAGASLPASAVESIQGRERDRAVLHPAPIGFREMLPGPHLGASWSVPILAGSGAVLGAFAVCCGISRKPAAHELDLIGKTSRLAAIAIEQRHLTDKLAHQAQHDALTGLPNRVLFEDRLQQALHAARRRGWLIAVLFVDLDRFKQINDTLGHPVGDGLLQQVARRLGGCIRKTDTLARMGGDEFTLLLTELQDYQYALTVAGKLLEALKASVPGGQLRAVRDRQHRNQRLSARRKRRRHAAAQRRQPPCTGPRAAAGTAFSSSGRNISASALETLEIENALRKALENGEFQLRYQPQVDTNGVSAALEALLVWNHPKLGLIPPAQFIPVAEECGLIIPIGSWVLSQACEQNAAWQRAGCPPVKVAVNVSVAQFNRPGFAEVVAQVLEGHRTRSLFPGTGDHRERASCGTFRSPPVRCGVSGAWA